MELLPRDLMLERIASICSDMGCGYPPKLKGEDQIAEFLVRYAQNHPKYLVNRETKTVTVLVPMPYSHLMQLLKDDGYSDIVWTLKVVPSYETRELIRDSGFTEKT
jgi:hypothetical protein